MTTPLQLDIAAALAGRYAIERELARGGMAVVYLARDLKHDRLVALKVLHNELAATLGPERFRREITVSAKLHHPHILSVFDSGETPSGRLWFSMPYVAGERLRDRIDREHQLPIDEAIRITREAALAIDYAHEHGIVHRDIKPENVMLTKDGSTLVADFGIARALDVPVADTGERLTGRGMVVGTPQYMSPEQAAGERNVGPRADVYSLGAVAYEMMTGEPPFSGPTGQAVIAKMMSGEPPSVRRSRPTVSLKVDAVIRKSLAPVPADRFATASEFARALETAARATTGEVESPPTARRGSRVPTTVALVGLCLLVGVGVLFAWRHRERGTPTVVTGPIGIAVLPFDNEGDTANAYFADGITDEIRGKLAALPALRLIASTSANQYRHTQKPAEQIGRELGVHYLLTGHVQWEQSATGTRRVRVQPELVEVREGSAPATKWQQSYDTTLADVFDVQSAVASRVADNLGVVLSSPAQTQIAARPTQNLAAYDAYLRSSARGGGDPATLRRSLAAAEEAVAIDSMFAAAWARVSRLHTILYASAVSTRADADAAHQAAERAVALAPDKSDGYIARGLYDLIVANDVRAARTAFGTAVGLAPSSSDALGGLGSVEATAGQWSLALSHSQQAATLDPRSAVAAIRLAQVLASLRRYPEARREIERVLPLAPTGVGLIRDRASTLLGEGNLKGAQASLRDISPEVDRPALIASVARSGLYWVLDSADRATVLALPVSAFDDDRGTWGLVRAMLYRTAGDASRARHYADSARVAIEAQLVATPDNIPRRAFHGLALAVLGQRAAAVREGTRQLAMAQATGDEFVNIPFGRYLLAEIYVVVGDSALALDQLDALLKAPNYISPAWLSIDPAWAPLRADPRFQRMIAQPAVVGAPT
jgi:eukaryotic-like serine/threonine-protein kinase